jgi:hypothetical protein
LDRGTEYLRELLTKHGFVPCEVEKHGRLRHRIEMAAGYPFVVALVRTVGTASETLLLLDHISKAKADAVVPPVVVIVPKEHRDAQFAFATEKHFGNALIECDRVDCADDSLGAKVLEELAALVIARKEEVDTRKQSDAVQVAADDNGRRAISEGGTPVVRAGFRMTDLFVSVGLFLLVVVTFAALWKLIGYAAAITISLALLALLVFGLFWLAGTKRISSPAIERLMSKLIDKVPSVRLRGPGDDESA